MDKCNSLKLNVRGMKFVGGTGNGNTEIGTVLAKLEAQKTLFEYAPNTNPRRSIIEIVAFICL